MSQLQLDRVVAMLDSVTARAEGAGKGVWVPAMTLGLSMDIPAETLDLIDPSLRPALYRRAKKAELQERARQKEQEVQQDLVGDDPEGNPDGLNRLKFPKVPGIAWVDKLLGYTLLLGSGLESTDPLEEDAVNLTDFWIEAKDGGTVRLSFKAAMHPDEENSGKLCHMIRQTVELTLIPPGESPQADLDPQTAE